MSRNKWNYNTVAIGQTVVPLLNCGGKSLIHGKLELIDPQFTQRIYSYYK
jgi:hypothetical protein